MARDILKTLKTEHDLVRDLFDELKATTDRASKKRSDLLAKIKKNLMPHAKWEEIVFYPAFKERADRDGLQTHAEAVEEHKAVEQTVIPDVEAADTGTPEFAGRAKVFAEFIEHHAKEEETTMFKMARKMFDAQERADFDVQYEEWKQSPAAANAIAGAEAKAALKATVKKAFS
jgi:hemerythrin-like domain-containing protein